MFGRLNGIIFALLTFSTSFLGSTFLLFPLLPLAYYGTKFWRLSADWLVGFWLTLPVCLVELIFKSKFHISGDLILRDKPALIVMNHRTRLDWMFFWNVLYKMDPLLLTTEKISLKAALKFIPGAGWAMGCGSFIFLERNFESDKDTIASSIQYYKESENTYQLLLFPEGTDRSVRSAVQSDSFAKRNGLPPYNYLLHPRTTGFNHLLNIMRKHNYVSYVYDVTVAYADVIVDSELRLLKEGAFPQNIHFDVKRYEISDIPADNESSAEWLKELWFEKEKRLRKFYETSSHDRRFDPSGHGYVWPAKWVCVLRSVAICPKENFPKPKGLWEKKKITALFSRAFENKSMMTYIFGAKVHVRGDRIDHSKPAIIIMNHRTRLDWLYFWNALYTMDPWLCTSEKITLKGILKYLPGAGVFCPF
ncbi:Acyltransferase [Dictyocaulus viviparus]|uniref:Acyltransferase n=1 Tax=Dictyocaulus viviparus TaxID=29172 RepID=A0A0D8Y689_DICVI|nr:Acyltransferase [Dictyocaulus viviparus]